MNAKLCLVMAAFMAAGVTVRAADERVSLNQLPAAVQRTIEASKSGGSVKEIVRRTVDGRVVYEVEIEKNNAPNPRFRVGEDGALIREPTPLVGTPDGVPIIAPEYPDLNEVYRSMLKLEDLPAAVQETVRREAGGRDIADIDEERWNGRRVYEVEFRQAGRNPQIHVAEDGMIVRENHDRATLKTLFLGTQLTDTPPAVQETVRRVAGDRPILDIDKRGSPGEVVYRVVVRSGSGREVLHIGEDGKLIQDRGTGAPARRGE